MTRGGHYIHETGPAQWFNFLLTSHFLYGLLSSEAYREMWLKLEFPLAGVAPKQENTGRGTARQMFSLYTIKQLY